MALAGAHQHKLIDMSTESLRNDVHVEAVWNVWMNRWGWIRHCWSDTAEWPQPSDELRIADRGSR